MAEYPAGDRGGARRSGAWLWLVVAGLSFAQVAWATEPRPSHATAADLAGIAASSDTRRMADWVIRSGDNAGLPFMIVDKVEARAFAFDPAGHVLGASPALLGLAHGDVSPPGIGSRKLADIAPSERITPSGRFVAALGRDLGTRDVLWVDYDAAISLHRVFTGTPSEHRLRRLETATTLDNRISYGCINVPVKFFDAVVHPLFAATPGIVYVLPETRSLAEAFPGFRSAEIGATASR